MTYFTVTISTTVQNNSDTMPITDVSGSPSSCAWTRDSRSAYSGEVPMSP